MNTTYIFTIGNVLSMLYSFSNIIYSTQSEFFRELFHSFHNYFSEKEKYEFKTDSAHVCRLLKDKVRFCKRIFRFYFIDAPKKQRLYIDTYRFLEQVLLTADQEDVFYNSFLSFVEGCENIHPRDRRYITAYDGESDTFDRAVELLYRILRVSIAMSVQHIPVYSK